MTVINQSYYPLQTSMSLINKMQDQFSTLQTQLATGLKANNLAQLGNDRYFDLSIRARMNRLDGYSDSIKMVNTRLSMFDQVTSRLGDTADSTRTASITPSAYGTDSLAYGTVPTLAQNNLDEVVNLLNTRCRWAISVCRQQVRPARRWRTMDAHAQRRGGQGWVQAGGLGAPAGRCRRRTWTPAACRARPIP